MLLLISAALEWMASRGRSRIARAKRLESMGFVGSEGDVEVMEEAIAWYSMRVFSG